jgi:hypothetical protein
LEAKLVASRRGHASDGDVIAMGAEAIKEAFAKWLVEDVVIVLVALDWNRSTLHQLPARVITSHDGFGGAQGLTGRRGRCHQNRKRSKAAVPRPR